jgi:thiosulfate reductase cytochrome b subunit
VRITHWLTAIAFLALLITGVEILISHPRFYWGEYGNVNTPALFELPIPASRSAVKTGYSFVLRDQNGWSRSLHFQAAWLSVLTGLLYFLSSVASRHFQDDLLPARADLTWPAISSELRRHLSFQRPDDAAYNVLQRISYLKVIFLLFPLIIWTGLAMSPAVVSAFPAVVTTLGGQQSARTIHFFCFLGLTVFVVVHIVMVCLAGFRSRTAAMITGRLTSPKERSS